MLTLHLIRHAKTNQMSSSGKDFDRELLCKGVVQANLLGSHLNQHHINLGKLLCSSAERTKQTSSILVQQSHDQVPTVLIEELYLAGYMEILNCIGTYSDGEQTVTVVGHNESISELASYLTEESIYLRTSEIITLQFSVDSWQQLFRGTGIIIFQYRPEVYLP